MAFNTAVLFGADTNDLTFANSDSQMSKNSGTSDYGGAYATGAGRLAAGSVYWETVTGEPDAQNEVGMGIVDITSLPSNWIGINASSWAVFNGSEDVFNNGANLGTSPGTFGPGDVIGHWIDAGGYKMNVNDGAFTQVVPAGTITGTFHAACSLANVSEVTMRTTAAEFTGTIPAGATAYETTSAADLEIVEAGMAAAIDMAGVADLEIVEASVTTSVDMTGVADFEIVKTAMTSSVDMAGVADFELARTTMAAMLVVDEQFYGYNLNTAVLSIPFINAL